MPSDKDLDAAGIPSTSTVQDMLDNAEDPRQAIAEFQKQNSLLLPSLKPVLKILELHNIRRKEYHELVLNKLSEKLLEKIKELGNSKNADDIKKLELQLDRCFKLYHVPKIRPIVLETLTRLPKVSNKILKKIIEDDKLYEECSVNVKQQIWLIKDELFTKAVGPVLDSYVDSKERILTSSSRSSNFFTCDTAKSRRQWRQIKELMNMIGTHEKLYQKLLVILRDRFTETDCLHYCSFRLELLMAIHDINITFAEKIDQAHNLSWCLDACVRDRHVDAQQMAKLKALLDKKKLTDEIVGDIAFMLGDSHNINFLCYATVKILCDNVRSTVEPNLPRTNTALPVLLRLLYLGASAQKIVNDEIVDQKTEMTACLTRFMPLFSQLIAQDLFRAELKKAPDEVADEFLASYEVQTPEPNLVAFVKTDGVCALLWFHYTLEVLLSKSRLCSKEQLEDYLKIVCKSKDKICMKEPWASLLTHSLIHSPFTEQHINDERFSKIVLHDFYMRGINHNTNNRLHLLHLYSSLMPHVLSEELTPKVLKAITPPVSHNGNSYVGRSSAKRFEKEFQQFVSLIQGKNAGETPTENHSIEIPIIAQPSDLLSAMQFDE